MPCARLSWPSHQLLSAHKSTVSYPFTCPFFFLLHCHAYNVLWSYQWSNAENTINLSSQGQIASGGWLKLGINLPQLNDVQAPMWSSPAEWWPRQCSNTSVVVLLHVPDWAGVNEPLLLRYLQILQWKCDSVLPASRHCLWNDGYLEEKKTDSWISSIV